MARTKKSPQTYGAPSEIVGAWTYPVDCALTDDATTTAQLDMRNFAMGMVQNATAGTVVITYWHALTEDGTAYALYDEDGVAVTQTLLTVTSAALPSACAGCHFLIPVVGTAATVSFAFKR